MLRTALTVAVASVACVGAMYQIPDESEANILPCQAIDFQQHQSIFKAANGAIDITNRISNWLLSFKDPFQMPTKTFETHSFHAFFSEFDVTPTIHDVGFSGFSHLKAHHMNTVSHTVLSVGSEFSNELRLKGAVNLHVVQKNRAWYTPCWTDMWHPIQCRPINTMLEIDLGVVNASTDVAILVELLECAKGIPSSVCADVTAGDLIKGAVTFQLGKLVDRFWMHMNRLEVKSVTLKFTKVTALKAQLTTSSWLLNKLQEKISSFSMHELNQHGAVYYTFMSFLGKIIQSIANFILDHTVVSHFGKTCIHKT